MFAPLKHFSTMKRVRLISYNFKSILTNKSFGTSASTRFANQMDDLYNMPIPESEPKKTVIQGFATGTPKYAAKQKDIFFDLIMKLKDGGLSEDKLTKLMVNTTVDKRHLAFPPHEYIESCLSPKRRKNIIKEVGGDLATSVARNAIANSGVNPEDIGQMVFVTSTELSFPGLDTLVIDNLELPKDIFRTPIYAQGCSPALRGLAAAKHFCMDNPGKAAIVICCELTSTMTNTGRYEFVDCMRLALFGDGCSAAVLTAEDVKPGDNKWVIEDYASHLVENTRKFMEIWVSDDGKVDMYISPDLPNLCKSEAYPFVDQFLRKKGLKVENIDAWAFHPGGAAILRGVQGGLELSDEKMMDSWNVLKNYGNMSSTSVLFVLEEIFKRKETSAEHILALTFGPGISMEQVLLKKM